MAPSLFCASPLVPLPGIYFSLYSLLRGMAVERRLEAQARAARLAGGAAAPPRDARSESISVGESLLVRSTVPHFGLTLG